MPEPPIHERYNRDDEQKPDRPQRMAQEPKGAAGSARSAKIRTDPASGEPLPGAPAPAGSDSDETSP